MVKLFIWEWFDRRHVGGQFVEANDSMSANIAEGFGGYHKKIKLSLCGKVFDEAFISLRQILCL
ncbi:MAG: hypothetical protein ACP5DZ_04590 [Bacteroidales bacterium]